MDFFEGGDLDFLSEGGPMFCILFFLTEKLLCIAKIC